MILEEYQYIDSLNGDKVLEYVKAVIKAVKITHSIEARCEKETKEMQKAVASEDKEYMGGVLQKHIQKYKNAIDSSSNIKIIYVQKEVYDQMTVEDVKKQLQILIGFVYTYEAKQSMAKETIKKCLEKILRQTGKFGKQEIEMLTR